MEESKRKAVEIGIPRVRVKTHIEIIKRRPGVVSSTGVRSIIDNIGRIVLGIINAVFECSLGIVIRHTAR
jgi:hypothetical protein